MHSYHSSKSSLYGKGEKKKSTSLFNFSHNSITQMLSLKSGNAEFKHGETPLAFISAVDTYFSMFAAEDCLSDYRLH